MLWTPDRQVIVPGRWPGIILPKRVRLPRLRRIPWSFVTESALISLNNDTDLNSYATASYTPTANALVLVGVYTSQAGGAPTTPTFSGNSLTYVSVNSTTEGGASIRRRLDVFRALGASPTAGAGTADYGGVSQTGCQISIAEFAGVDTTGTNGSGAVVQSATNNSAGNDVASLTVTLAAFGSAANATYGAIFCGFVSEAQTPGTGFTGIHDIAGASPARRLMTEWRNDNDTTVDESSATIDVRGGVALEIKAAAAAAGALYPPPFKKRTNVLLRM